MPGPMTPEGLPLGAGRAAIPSGGRARAMAALSAFGAWWAGELASMVPRRAAAWLRRPGPGLALDLGDGRAVLRALRGRGGSVEVPLGGDGMPVASSVDIPAGEAVVRLPVGAALLRRVELPLLSDADLGRLLGFEMSRWVPLPPAEARWAHRVVRRDAASRRMTVEIAVAEAAAVERALDLARSLGLRPARVAPADMGDGAGDAFDLSGATADGPARVGRPALLLAALAGVLALVAAWAEIGARERELALLEAEVAAARVRASAVERLRAEADAMERRGRFLADRRREPAALDVLAELTRRLPDDAWLHEARLDGRGLRLRGQAASAAGLLTPLEDSPLFAGARFASPVMQDGKAGRERFELVLDLARRDGVRP